MVGLLSLGKNDFEAIEPFREDRFFREALGIAKGPSPEWLRQRIDARSETLRDRSGDIRMRLLERAEAPITAHAGYVRLGFDPFTRDNSGTQKEEVSRTYQGFDGSPPIAAYLGNEGWGVGLELRPGARHSAFGTEHFLERPGARILRCRTAGAQGRKGVVGR